MTMISTIIQGLGGDVSSEMPAMSDNDEIEPGPQQAPSKKQGLEDFTPSPPSPLPGEFVCRIMHPMHFAKHRPFTQALEHQHNQGLSVDHGQMNQYTPQQKGGIMSQQ
jgi:hypothetical protein